MTFQTYGATISGVTTTNTFPTGKWVDVVVIQQKAGSMHVVGIYWGADDAPAAAPAAAAC